MKLIQRSIVAALTLFPSLAFAQLAPVPITGYNHDVIVEVGAGDLLNAVTATMDAGTAKTGDTWYQQGFNATAPTTGLPIGSNITSQTGHGTFRLQPAAGNNAILLNAASNTATVNLTTPAAYPHLAFYSSSGNGVGTLNYTLNFVGGATQTGTFTSPDWFFVNENIAYVANGRVQPSDESFDAVNSGNPRVYEQLITVNNPSALLSGITLNWTGSTANANTAILALSGGLVPEPTTLAFAAITCLGLLSRRPRR